MKQFLLRAIKIFSIGYWSVYFVSAFIQWKFYNPFQWIIDIPSGSNEYRGGILAIMVFTALILSFLTDMIYYDKPTNTRPKK